MTQTPALADTLPPPDPAAVTASAPETAPDDSVSTSIPTSTLTAPTGELFVATGSALGDSDVVGDCLEFSISVPAAKASVALQPISENLTGPYADNPSVGTTAAGDNVGTITARWDGNDWSYDHDCIQADAAGWYVWVISNPNDDETGNDRSVHPHSIVKVRTATIATTEPARTPDAADQPPDDHQQLAVMNPHSGSGTASKSQLAETGVNITNLVGIAGFAIGGLGVGGLVLLVHARRAHHPRTKTKDMNK